MRLALALCLLSSVSAMAGPVGYYRQPALRGESVYFVGEGDLWRVGTQGGEAQRLTTHPGLEAQPAVSLDGRWLAFTAQYDGVTEVYVMPAAGGVPKRLTWEGGSARVWGFAASGEVIVSAPDVRPTHQLFAIDPQTARRRALPVGQASDGALSADGQRLYFTRSGLSSDNAKAYRGGAMARLWVMDLASEAEARPLLAEGQNDKRPLPYATPQGERVAFVSDRDGSFNLWSANAEGGDLRQHTRHQGWDIRSASIDGSRVVYALGADLYLVDLASSAAPRKLEVSLTGDFDQQRTRWVKRPQDFLTDTALSPSGERVLIGARGHLATQGLAGLRRAELPVAADGRCRKAQWSADGKSVFAFCDFSGEFELWRLPANGVGSPQQLTRDASTQRMDLLPSPDGRWVAHSDKEGRIYLTDLKAQPQATTVPIARDKASYGVELAAWSPDSQALALVLAERVADRPQVALYDLPGARLHLLTSDRYASDTPSFSPDGKWLYFVSNRHFAVTGNGSPWGDRNMGPFFDKRGKLYALALQPGLRSPFAPKDELDGAEAKPEEKKPADPKPESKKAEDKKADALAPKAAKASIVYEGLAQRLVELPLPAGNYRDLQVEAKRLWVLDEDLDHKSALKSVAIDNKGEGFETLSGDVRSYALSGDGKKLMLVRNAGGGAPDILVVEAAAKLPGDLAKATLRWSDWQIATQPKQEWRQMFADAWRLQRDHLYDPAMRGVDWKAVRAKYEPLVERVTDRYELADLMAQMVSELGTLHSQVGPGDTRQVEEPALAGLGARFSAVPGGWRIDHLYAADPELPSEASPLAQPGLGLREGDVITAINGHPASSVPHPYELLRGQAGKQVLLQLQGGVSKIVTPVAQMRENQLRYNDWRVSRAKRVEQQGQGRIGYVHLRAMGPNDIADFAREFYAASDREGLIIDVRFNNGGNIDSWVLDRLMRRAWMWWQRRSPEGAAAYPNMQHAFRGQVVVLTNEETYSDGETFAEGFKRLGLGPVIGKQTSGAGVFLSDRNRLLDNGIMRAAESAQIDAEGRQLIEGVGVKPDVVVDNLPRATFKGEDAQLDAAIAELHKRMAAQPLQAVKPQRPYPGLR